MYFTIYKITNKINGKIYIGAHQCDDLNDGYMGSGTDIKEAITEYGVNNFNKEILFNCSSSEEMFQQEKEIVNEMFLKSEKIYNLNIGGWGSWYYINSSNEFIDAKRLGRKRTDKILLQKYNVINPGQLPENRKKTSERTKKLHKLGKLPSRTGQEFKGKHHTAESKKLIGEKNAINFSGEKNPNYGKKWITNGFESKSVNKIDLIPEGWRKGRIVKM